ncbi:Phosphoribosylformylglycinamidine synthase [Fragariocoptes setiger]|uniref:Phosphoribosylformylglycinamidine synthase n=1 Tax=Fragariocoptes setiger TaxID=1670756 RepID=A0ABQ7S5G0_9ACAR|nr:Phosphoribosylformylglycinamidine synthase [Fragariocoptes setiger]
MQAKLQHMRSTLADKFGPEILEEIVLDWLDCEHCFYVWSTLPLSRVELDLVRWLIEPPAFHPKNQQQQQVYGVRSWSHVRALHASRSPDAGQLLIEIGPRLTHCTPFSSNAVAIVRSALQSTREQQQAASSSSSNCDDRYFTRTLSSIERIERSTIYSLRIINNSSSNIAASDDNDERISAEVKRALSDALHDRMVEMVYATPVDSFEPQPQPQSLQKKNGAASEGEDEDEEEEMVDLCNGGADELRRVSQRMGLALDEWDIEMYVDLFVRKLKRNPTVVECFDLAQSNSEHSRHWFFKGVLDIEGREPPRQQQPQAQASTPTNEKPRQQSQTNEEGAEETVEKVIDERKYFYNNRPSLFEMVSETQHYSNRNNVIAFADNSSAVRGYRALHVLRPDDPTCASPMRVHADHTHRHIIFTAETHNFPTGVAPFAGAATGVGGRLRDVHATGRGAHPIAGTAGYSFGSLDGAAMDLSINGREVRRHLRYPTQQLAPPERIAIEASNGASDYGNKFGEPIVAGFARSFGMRLRGGGASWGANGQTSSSQRWEYVKPIMFTGGLGTIDAHNVNKLTPTVGMCVAKVGGPVYRIGMGGGAASSATATTSKGSKGTDGDNDNADELNFHAVQRGDPEMEQKLNRIIRGAIELQPNEANPIFSIHDQGAGGNGNVLKEIVEPLGAIIEAGAFTLGDPTCSTLELWTAEYQESDAILTSEAHRTLLSALSRREKCAVDFVGRVTGDGRVRLVGKPSGITATAHKSGDNVGVEYEPDWLSTTPTEAMSTIATETTIDKRKNEKKTKQLAIDLQLDHVIGKMPRKLFKLRDYSTLPKEDAADSETRAENPLVDRRLLDLCACIGPYALVERVLRVPAVASKRWLTVKVDRCVTGLIAQQQCVGPWHTPVADYACVALTHFDVRGACTAIGEQPIKGLARNGPRANAHMSVAEAITNMMFCCVSAMRDIKCSANWMWAAKLEPEGAKLVDTCAAMCALMSRLGIAVDGGKDSLSMSASVPPAEQNDGRGEAGEQAADQASAELVKAPGTLVVSAYAPVPDIRLKVTPVMHCVPGKSHLLLVDLCTARSSHTRAAKMGGGVASPKKGRLGGSALLQSLGEVGEHLDAPEIDEPHVLVRAFQLIQTLIAQGICTAGHDVSDGGLLVCLIEMALATDCGLRVAIPSSSSGSYARNKDDEQSNSSSSNALNQLDVMSVLFAEECACVIEVTTTTSITSSQHTSIANDGQETDELEQILAQFYQRDIDVHVIGCGSFQDPTVSVAIDARPIMKYTDISALRQQWEAISCALDMRQARRACVRTEYDRMSAPRSASEHGKRTDSEPEWRCTFDMQQLSDTYACPPSVAIDRHLHDLAPRVAVIREEGTNGDREMCASLTLAGFQVFDVTLNDLLLNTGINTSSGSIARQCNQLLAFQGLVFPGGFSYGDVFGSARGFGAVIRFNATLRRQLEQFCRRSTSFTLGVCNGCQLMSLLGLLTLDSGTGNNDDHDHDSDTTDNDDVPLRLTHNNSGRFECRFVNVRIEPTTNAIMLRDMHDSVLGVWVAHAEGKFVIDEQRLGPQQAALRYCDTHGTPTQQYPLNPNGSVSALAGLCSPDGRHLAMMPHPERCTLKWQWPYVAPSIKHAFSYDNNISPWMKMFANAYEFSVAHMKH